MKRKLWIAVGVSMLAIFASALFPNGARADGESEDDLNLWQLVAERMGDPEYYDDEVDGVLDFEDLALLHERVAEELGISADASGSSGGGTAPLTGACSSSSGVITCAVTTTYDNPYVLVGLRNAATNEIIMCESDDDVNYEETGSEFLAGEDYLSVVGTSGVDKIKIVNSATSVGECSFKAFLDLFSEEILIRGQGRYDYIYGSNYHDVLIGEYIVGYSGDDDLYIETNQTGMEYAWGGGGDDYLQGVAGSQKLYGEGDNDLIYGYGGDDYVSGGDGNDRLYGDTTTCDDYADKDTLLGGDGDDVLWGQCGDDKLDAQGGTRDVCHGDTNLMGGGYIGDGCDYDDCESFDGCEYDWDSGS